MKIVRNRILPFGKKYAAINLFGVFFVKRHVCISRRLINHESIHTAQQRELFYVPFYVIYIAEWLVRLIFAGFDNHKAYRAISFEREAYDNDSDLGYLRNRRHFSQWRTNQRQHERVRGQRPTL